MRTFQALACAAVALSACATAQQHVYAVKETTRADSIDYLGWKGLKLPPDERWTVVQYSDDSQSLHRQTPGPHLKVVPFSAQHEEGCAGELRRRFSDSERATVEHGAYYVPASYAQDALVWPVGTPWRSVSCYDRAPGSQLIVVITAPGAPSSEDARSLKVVLDGLARPGAP